MTDKVNIFIYKHHLGDETKERLRKSLWAFLGDVTEDNIIIEEEVEE